MAGDEAGRVDDGRVQGGPVVFQVFPVTDGEPFEYLRMVREHGQIHEEPSVRQPAERTRGDRPQFASRPFQCAGPVGDDGAQREEPRMPVRPVEQAEPVGEPHAGQVHAIIDGPVEPAMVGEQELGAEQADAGRIQENIACQGVQRVRETFRRVLARRRLRRDDEAPSGVSAMKQAHPLAISMGFMPSAIGFGSHLSPSVR